MRKTKIDIDVVIIDEDDLAGVTDEARVTGKMEAARQAIAENFDRHTTVQVGMTERPRKGAVPWVSIGGVRLFAGEAVAFLPTGPAKIDVPEKAPAVKKTTKKASAKE